MRITPDVLVFSIACAILITVSIVWFINDYNDTKNLNEFCIDKGYLSFEETNIGKNRFIQCVGYDETKIYSQEIYPIETALQDSEDEKK